MGKNSNINVKSFPSPEDITSSIKWENILGIGTAVVYRVEGFPQYVVKIDDFFVREVVDDTLDKLFKELHRNKRPAQDYIDLSQIKKLGLRTDKDLQKSKYRIPQPVEIPSDPALLDRNFSQPVASYGKRITLLRFQSGKPCGLPEIIYGYIDSYPDIRERLVLESLQRVAGMPVKAYGQLLEQFSFLTRCGYMVDWINANNVLVDPQEKKFNFIDLSRKVDPVRDRNTFENRRNPLILLSMICSAGLEPRIFERGPPPSAESVNASRLLKESITEKFLEAYEALDPVVKKTFTQGNLETVSKAVLKRTYGEAGLVKWEASHGKFKDLFHPQDEGLTSKIKESVAGFKRVKNLISRKKYSSAREALKEAQSNLRQASHWSQRIHGVALTYESIGLTNKKVRDLRRKIGVQFKP